MKQRILDALKTKFAGIGDSILTRVAEKLAKTATNEEEADKAVEGYTLSNLLESYGDNRANEAQKSAVKNYEAKYNLKDGQPVANGGTDGEKDKQPQGGDDMPEWAKGIMEENRRLSETLANMNKARVTEGRKSQLASVIKKLPASLQKAYERTSLEGSDEEFNTLLTTITSEVDEALKDTKQRGAVFKQPMQGANGDPSKLTDEQIKAIASKPSQSADAQPF